jgi:hypothetical protein
METRKCEINDITCGGRIEGHHDDYSKPKEVRYMCRKHHVEFHKTMGPLACKGRSERYAFNLTQETVDALMRHQRTMTQQLERDVATATEAERLHLVCAWCGKIMRVGGEKSQTTHGICEACAAKENAKMDAMERKNG